MLSVENYPRLHWFCFTTLCDWFRKLAPPSRLIRYTTKLIVIWSNAFSRARGRLNVFTLSSHWLPVIFSLALIGRCDYFGFGFTTPTQSKSALYININQSILTWHSANISLDTVAAMRFCLACSDAKDFCSASIPNRMSSNSS